MGNAASADGAAAASPTPATESPSAAPGTVTASSNTAAPTGKVPNNALPNHGPDDDEGKCSSVRRNMRIYEKHTDEAPALKELPVLSEKQSKIINHTLSHLFYSSSQALSPGNFEYLLRRMTRIHFHQNKRLVKEGEESKEMIIIEEGSLQIMMGGKNVRVLEPGNLFGELALIFNAPRGATVDAITDGFYWTLSRDDFKRMQRKLAGEVTANYVKMFNSIPYVTTCLDPTDMALLVQDLVPITYEPGENIYCQDDVADKVIVIDEGVAEIQFKPHEGLLSGAADNFTFAGVTLEILETKYGIYGNKFINDSGETESSVAITEELGPNGAVITHIFLKHGTIIIGPLWSKAMLCEGWTERKLTMLHAYRDKKGHYAKASRAKTAPHAPFSVLAKDDFIKCSHFTLGQFESKIGKISEAFKIEHEDVQEGHEHDDHHHREAVKAGILQDKEEVENFHNPAIIPGSIDYNREFCTGSFSKFKYRAKIFLGFVGIAETTVTEQHPEPITCFLKIFNKNRAATKKQVSIAWFCYTWYSSLSYIYIILSFQPYLIFSGPCTRTGSEDPEVS